MVYVGRNTSVSIAVNTLASSYWFKVYNYSEFFTYQDTKYIYVPSSGTKNQAEASFPSISLPTITDIITQSATLTTEDIGGTITNIGGSPISEKGTYSKTSTFTVITGATRKVDSSGSAPYIGSFSSSQNFIPKTRYFLGRMPTMELVLH